MGLEDGRWKLSPCDRVADDELEDEVHQQWVVLKHLREGLGWDGLWSPPNLPAARPTLALLILLFLQIVAH